MFIEFIELINFVSKSAMQLKKEEHLWIACNFIQFNWQYQMKFASFFLYF